MQRICIILVVCLLGIACNNKPLKPNKPDHLIPKDKMEKILYDLYVINAAKGVNKKLLEKNGFVPETYVLTKHNIDSTQFADSNAYYAFDPDSYKKIVENVKAKLEKRKEEFEEIQKIESQKAKRKRDSLRLKQKKKDSIKKIEILKKQDSTKIL